MLDDLKLIFLRFSFKYHFTLHVSILLLCRYTDNKRIIFKIIIVYLHLKYVCLYLKYVLQLHMKHDRCIIY